MADEPERSDRRAEAARRYEEAAAQLELAAVHLRRTAEHFRADDVPRACAHVVAARGGVVLATRELDDLAVEHLRRASV